MNYTRYLSLNAQVVYAEPDPHYCGLLDQICKHDGAWHLPPTQAIPREPIDSIRPQASKW